MTCTNIFEREYPHTIRYKHTDAHAHMQTYTHTQVSSYAYMTHTHIWHTHIYDTHTYMTHTHGCEREYLHTTQYTHTDVHTHMQTYTHTQMSSYAHVKHTDCWERQYLHATQLCGCYHLKIILEKSLLRPSGRCISPFFLTLKTWKRVEWHISVWKLWCIFFHNYAGAIIWKLSLKPHYCGLLADFFFFFPHQKHGNVWSDIFLCEDCDIYFFLIV